jgi:HrpA-like RNA helicase
VARQLGGDGGLDRYDAIVVDEVHERHVTADFLVAVLKDVVEKRREMAEKGEGKRLKVVLMSATMDLEMWGNYLGGCPIVEVG